MKRFDFLETRYRLVIVNWALISAGFLAIVIGNEVAARNVLWWGVNVGNNIVNVGSLVGIIGLMQWTYDAFSRRKFFEEVITSVSGTRAIYDVGIVDAQQLSHEADLKDEISLTEELTLVFSHSKRFVDRYHHCIVERTRAGKKTTVYLNHKDSKAVAYYVSCGRSQGYIHENIDEFIRVLRAIDKNRGLISIKLIDIIPKYALVKADRTAYFIFSTSSEGQVGVPLVTVRKDTPIWRFISDDLSHIDQNHVRESL